MHTETEREVEAGGAAARAAGRMQERGRDGEAPKRTARGRAGRRGREAAGAVPLPGPEPAAAPRQPRQERGRRRVDAILDGVAAMVAEVGVVGVTVHGVAKRSGTAIGSIYHFFPDRDAMLTALADRHVAAMRQRMAELREERVDWAGLSAGEAVRRFLTPFLTYFDEHPDYLPVIRAMSGPGGVTRRHPELLLGVIDVAAMVLRARRPELTEEEIAARSTTIVGAMEGLLSMTLRPTPSTRPALMRELERLLAAYVAADEGSAGAT